MAGKRIIWSAIAKSELKNTLAFYTKRNKSATYSLKLLAEIEDLLKTLAHNEFIGRLSSNKKTRIIPIKAYLILYEIKKDSIQIVSFWDNRQEDKKFRL
ncbi:type II toxin-antitoxin system RelE/ParE family toxin [Haloflavibacter putidus]|uniref:Type II toxin-antitoxin system RelE/ParE family toxin n=1 Tax=Haloflavibacter putidus TaxID=2576776 RepID=A0A507ZAA8_9FLAO|nr:type II toxin-antitoxin system RelE/ParE family toxin [Haloflavibacter putidus]TQD33999.1 type II toxin-antitoxin system RelE/ParE family toxin [Haloflavibacter putidus]